MDLSGKQHRDRMTPQFRYELPANKRGQVTNICDKDDRFQPSRLLAQNDGICDRHIYTELQLRRDVQPYHTALLERARRRSERAAAG